MKHNTQLKLSLLTVAFAFLGSAVCTEAVNYVTVFSDGFESYTAGAAALDKNVGGPNSAPNGSGNPWWGPVPPNMHVVGTEGSVTPHSGNQMIRGNPAGSDFDQDYYNLAYRLRGGQAPTGNYLVEWWFYDPSGSGDSHFQDYVALGWYALVPGGTDYPSGGTVGGVNQRLSLGGGFNPSAAIDFTKYQARVVGATDGLFAGWFNLSLTRSVGWHQGRIVLGEPAGASTQVSFYIDDMTNPLLVHNITLGANRSDVPSPSSLNVIEVNGSFSTTIGYFDDLRVALAQPPNLTVTQSGSNAILTWSGLGFTLQSTSSLLSPISWTDVTGATSPYSYDTTSGPQQFFRLKN